MGQTKTPIAIVPHEKGASKEVILRRTTLPISEDGVPNEIASTRKSGRQRDAKAAHRVADRETKKGWAGALERAGDATRQAIHSQAVPPVTRGTSRDDEQRFGQKRRSPTRCRSPQPKEQQATEGRRPWREQGNKASATIRK